MPKTTQSVQYAAQVAAASNFASRLNDKRQIDGNISTALVKVVLDGSNVATDVITLLELPPGAIVLPERCKIIVTNDMTSGALTLHVGDVVDADRYCVSANCAATGVIDFIAASATTFPDGFGTRHQADAAAATTLVTCTLATLTATIEAGEFYVSFAYKTL